MTEVETTVFQAVKRESTRDKVYLQIREAIFMGKLKTGQRIAEVPLAEEFSVSRAIVREALQRLSHEGLVEHNSFKGARVVHLSPQQIDEIVHVRLLLESDAVRLAHGRMTGGDRDELRRRLETMRQFAGDPGAYRDLDLKLHARIWELSGNETLAKMLMQVVLPLFAMGALLRHSTLRAKPGDHTALVEKLCAGAADEAVREMQFHITENWKNTRRALEEYLAAQ